MSLESLFPAGMAHYLAGGVLIGTHARDVLSQQLRLTARHPVVSNDHRLRVERIRSCGSDH